jgi:tRNA threonylcarbamoyladenosine biosynthesis protein TsaE
VQIFGDLNLSLPLKRDTRRLGYALAEALRAGDVIVLEGDLAAGKTFLARAIARGLGVPTSVPITSPTFDLVHEIPGAPFPLLHVDLFRLESEDQLVELGLVSVGGGEAVVVVEWGDRFLAALGNDGLRIGIVLDAERGRTARIHAYGDQGRALLKRLSDELARREKTS